MIILWKISGILFTFSLDCVLTMITQFFRNKYSRIPVIQILKRNTCRWVALKYFLTFLVFLILVSYLISLKSTTYASSLPPEQSKVLTVVAVSLPSIKISIPDDERNPEIIVPLRKATKRPPDKKSKSKTKTEKSKRLCSSAIGTLKANVSHDVGNFKFHNPFTPTPGWDGPIEFEWKSSQAYPYQFFNSSEVQYDTKENETCNSPNPTLDGKMSLQEFMPDLEWEDIISRHPEVRIGGYWEPTATGEDALSKGCPNVAIIIPYRDRVTHLKIVINTLHMLLQRQQVSYRIFVAEQFGENRFSRGITSNAAFAVALRLFHFDCIIFHDVDLLPENNQNLYNCDQSPRHFAVAIEKFNYTMPYYRYFGGVLAFKPEHFLLINGYPNTYWGWGGEDDDLYFRTEALNLPVWRRPPEISNYKMLDHSNEQRLPSQFVCDLLRTARTRYSLDGISTLEFRLLAINYVELYTHLMIDVGLPDRVHYKL